MALLSAEYQKQEIVMPNSELNRAHMMAQIGALPLESKRRLLTFLRFLTESEYTELRPGASQEKEMPSAE